MSNQDLELIQEFANDSLEILENIADDIIALSAQIEENSVDEDLIASIFRTFHSIKGGAGFMNLTIIQKTAHTAENLLDLIRSKKIELTQSRVDLFVVVADFLIKVMNEIQNTGDDKVFEDESKTIISLIEMNISESMVEKTLNEQLVEKIKESQEEKQKKIFDENFVPEITPEIMSQFISDSEELLGNLETKIFKVVESGEISEEFLKENYRLIHTLKGNCGFMGFEDLEKLLHCMETVLSANFSGVAINFAETGKVFLQLISVLKDAIANIASKNDGKIDNLELYIEFIKDLLPKNYIKDETKKPLGEILKDEGLVSEEDLKRALDKQRQPLGEILKNEGLISEEDLQKVLEKQRKETVKIEKKKIIKTAKKQKKEGVKKNNESIRVAISKLDTLINLIGELIISQNIIASSKEIHFDEMSQIKKAVLHMEKIVRDLQDTAVNIRMIPLSGLFKKMHRLIYDLSNKLKKKTNFIIFGEDTELDKTMIELITDPLVHILRNSMDHGLETTEQRIKRGKPEKGEITLGALQEDGEIKIIVKDDGNGINKEKIKQKALEKGLVTKESLAEMSENQIFSLIFEPGFSTADKVSNVSGRGVGMDVVKKNLEKINGKINIKSKEGEGTEIVLRIPLTLAIIEGMRVQVGNVDYTIPLASIKQFYKIKKEDITLSPDGTETIRIRENLYKVIRLHKIHNLKPKFENLEDGIILLVEIDEKIYALFVDKIIAQQQTVVKSIPKSLGKIRGVYGCTILGNGRISLILEPKNLI